MATDVLRVLLDNVCHDSFVLSLELVLLFYSDYVVYYYVILTGFDAVRYGGLCLGCLLAYLSAYLPVWLVACLSACSLVCLCACSLACLCVYPVYRWLLCYGCRILLPTRLATVPFLIVMHL